MLYSSALWLYRQGIRIAAHRGHRKARFLNDGLNCVWSKLRDSIGRHDRVIWIHAASLGEFEQGRPLMEKLHGEHPEYKILLTFFSPSGYEVRKNYSGADVVAYLPLDTRRNVSRFLEIVNPEKAFFIKYEFWPNYLRQLRKRNIDTYLISGIFRHGQLFFKPYGGFYRNLLRSFKTLYVQDHGSKRLLADIGITNVIVAGDTRFDRVTDIMHGARRHPVLDRFCGTHRQSGDKTHGDTPLIFMAGSSWPEDEAVYADWLERTPGIRGVIAPHEFDNIRLKKLLEKFRDKAILLSDAERCPDAADNKKILIIDCFGLLSSAYAYADIAYVGGAFGSGLHNINEAAVYGIPVIYGPNHQKFIEAEEMKTLGGGISVSGLHGFERAANRLVRDPKERLRRGKWAGEYIKSKLGATDRIYLDIFGHTQP